MKVFTFKKGLVGNGLFAQSSFKSFIVLVVMMIMTTSSAMAEYKVIDGLRYFLNSETKTASLCRKLDGFYSGDIVVPEKVRGNDGVEYVVDTFEASFDGCSGLTSVTIPSTVRWLGNCTFKGCTGLKSITIPESVTTLEQECFRDCTGLTSITIPSSVTFISAYCFYNCSNLIYVKLSSNLKELSIGSFAGCSGLTFIKIPSSVTFIKAYCFNDCVNLKNVYFEGIIPDAYNHLSWGIPTSCTIKAPEIYLQGYKNAFGSDYKYEAWNPYFLCATPTISYEFGELKFDSETYGAEYCYTISDADVVRNAYSKGGKISLSGAYKILAYATADGYGPSEKAEATLYWINANLETANINLAKTRGIVASAHDGIVSISGLDNGEVVKFYAADGKLLGSSSAVGGVASCAVSEKMVIAKIGMDTIKVLMK